MAANRIIQISAVIDFICPWCFIGKRRMEKAIHQIKSVYPNVEFNVTWHPYQIIPDMSREPQSKLPYIISRFGEKRTAEMVPYMQQVGQKEGIHFSYDGVVADTLDAQRLLHWSHQFGKQNEVVEEIFKDYSETKACISDSDVLVSIAERVGLDKTKALHYLKSEEDFNYIRNEIKKHSQGIFGVPNFVIQDKYTLSGAQESHVFSQLFEEILNEMKI
ncbi:DSBA-like thioredoxin domain-containing protein [Spinellus fusiger]|nr:DSBA-like thioredoxin domain-containing protein [Spinellus fusiger]